MMATLYSYSFLPLEHKDWCFHWHTWLQRVWAGQLPPCWWCTSLFGGAVPPVCLTPLPCLVQCNGLSTHMLQSCTMGYLCSSFMQEKTPGNYSSCIHSMLLFSNHLRRLYRSEKCGKVLWDGLWIPLIFKLTFSGVGLPCMVFTF